MDAGRTDRTMPDGSKPVRAPVYRPSETDGERLSHAVATVTSHVHAIIQELNPSSNEFRAVLSFLTDVGHHSDSRRQEWVLLADVLGVSTLVEDLNSLRPPGATPNTVAGPFYRADVPETANGASISRDGKGEPLFVSGKVRMLDGKAVAGAVVEVWHANAQGIYENQDPDGQPEFNLRGRLTTDGEGAFRFTSVKPKGYALPDDGPVGQLMKRIGLPARRPAHLHFRVSADGCETLTTLVFDRADPTARDAIIGQRPELMADFVPSRLEDGRIAHLLDLTFVLCRSTQQPSNSNGRK